MSHKGTAVKNCPTTVQ